jgi:hypothetical protein
MKAAAAIAEIGRIGPLLSAAIAAFCNSLQKLAGPVKGRGARPRWRRSGRRIRRKPSNLNREPWRNGHRHEAGENFALATMAINLQ